MFRSTKAKRTTSNQHNNTPRLTPAQIRKPGQRKKNGGVVKASNFNKLEQHFTRIRGMFIYINYHLSLLSIISIISIFLPIC